VVPGAPPDVGLLEVLVGLVDRACEGQSVRVRRELARRETEDVGVRERVRSGLAEAADADLALVAAGTDVEATAAQRPFEPLDGVAPIESRVAVGHREALQHSVEPVCCLPLRAAAGRSR
jgi:hypothetical protein